MGVEDVADLEVIVSVFSVFLDFVQWLFVCENAVFVRFECSHLPGANVAGFEFGSVFVFPGELLRSTLNTERIVSYFLLSRLTVGNVSLAMKSDPFSWHSPGFGNVSRVYFILLGRREIRLKILTIRVIRAGQHPIRG